MANRDLPNYGYGPMTDQSRRGRLPEEVRTAAPDAFMHPIVRALMKYGPVPAKLAVEAAAQPVRGGEALAEAINDPTLANITNAGVQGAMSVPTLSGVKAAAAALGLGLGTAGLQQSGAFDMEAHARGSRRRSEQDIDVPDLPGLSDEENATYKTVLGRITRGAYENSAARRALEAQAKIFTDKSTNAGAASVAAKLAKTKADQEEFERSVTTAEETRNAELARDRRFSETPVGKVWDKTGGWGPFLVAAGLGGLGRAASGGGSALKNYAFPAGEGAAAGALSTNIPLAYNAFFTEPDNPQRRAYEAYARDLPAGHPRKAEWSDYAKTLPEANPVRKVASEELYDPIKASERMLFGALEGIGGGLAGSQLMQMPRRFAAARGEMSAEYQNGMANAASARRSRAEADSLARGSEVAAAEARAASAEALRRSNAQKAGPSEAISDHPVSPPGPPPPGGSFSNQVPTSIELAPSQEMRDMMAEILSGVQARGGKKALPSPSGQGPWVEMWSEPARDAVAAHLSQGGSIARRTGMTAPKLLEALEGRLPAGAKLPGKSEANARLNKLRERVGNNPTSSEFDAWRSKTPIDANIFGIGAAGAAGLGAASQYDFDPQALARALMLY